jgi:hypothetical protein
MRTAFRRMSLALAGVLMLSAISACGTPPTLPQAVQKTEDFSGTVQVGGNSVKTFIIEFIGPTNGVIELKSLTSAANAAALNVTIGVYFGTYVQSSNTCIKSSLADEPALAVGTSKQTIDGLFPGSGTYCFAVYDAGTLKEAANYTVAIKHY